MTGFYMMATLAFNELIRKKTFTESKTVKLYSKRHICKYSSRRNKESAKFVLTASSGHERIIEKYR